MSKYTRTPLSEVTSIPNGMVMAYRDYYWVVTPEEEILKFKKASWQCNTHEAIVKRLCPEGCSVRQIPVVFIPVNPHDYC